MNNAMLLYYFGLLFLLFVKRICCFLIYPLARSPYSKGYWVINDHETLRSKSPRYEKIWFIPFDYGQFETLFAYLDLVLME